MAKSMGRTYTSHGTFQGKGKIILKQIHRAPGQVDVLAGQLNCRGSLPRSASNVLELCCALTPRNLGMYVIPFGLLGSAT